MIPTPRTLRSFFALVLATVVLSSAAFANDEIFTKVDEAPVPVKTPPPKYPDALRRDGVSGLVAVSVVIDEKGAVISSEISKASAKDFEQPSLDAVKNWKFKPAKVGGNPVKVRVTIPLRFNLNE